MTETTRQPCDLLIEAGWVVPVNPHGVVLVDHAVVVSGDRIVALLPLAEARERFAPAQTVSRPDSVLIPGLVNGHTHNPMTLMRGVADDLSLMPWLHEHVWPIEGAVMSPEFVADGVELAVAEMLRGGTTCCNESYFFPDAQAATYRRLGFRARVGLPVIEFPSAWAASTAEYFDKGLEVYDNYRSDPLVSLSFAPHAPYTVSDESFERIRMLAEQLDLPVHVHVHETAQEIADSLKQYGQRPIARLDRLGVVNERLIAVHMTQLIDAEIALCAERGVSVLHCPQSNLKLASGFSPVEKLRRAGVNLGLGTDGCASNNDLDMFDEMRTAALLAKGVAMDATALDAASALRIATLGSAKALGLDEHIGSIEVGKQADLTLIAMDALETQPMYNAISHLVYATGRHQVSDVWIAGQRKLADRELVGIDVDALRAKTRQWQQRIAAIGNKP
ncbi:MAG TPA: TRZ/ATZ family hydrolase [Arenimonas sp.]|uniref:TRZ/ATZ family hydrolase n=1 Tax=Arenimonas sp. TaxID=1872635 RepID=UPI002C81450E|nr:TRZ/ATZ family hydrolase [Arenimonas sp.]HMB55999.1 TRZ/ATZ family hydrolase [Arenimonas sp.]